MSDSTLSLLKVVGPVAAVLLTGLGWYIKRGFDLRGRDREFVVGVVKAGLHFVDVVESALTGSVWLLNPSPDKVTASQDLKARHLLVDMGATKYKEVLVEAQARLPPRVYKALSAPLGQWSITRMNQSAYNEIYAVGGPLPDHLSWLETFRVGVWNDWARQRKLLAKISNRY